MACTGQQPASESTPESAASVALLATGTIPAVPNDLADNSVSHSLEVPGEIFGLTADYWTSYDAANWQTLEPKSVNLSVHLTPKGSGAAPPEVLIGGFGAVAALTAAMPGLDGLPVAESADRSPALPGYLITKDFPFDAVLPIEGYSTALLDRWRALAGDQPLTEQGLVDAGVNGNRLTFTYRVLVKNTGDRGYHLRVVQDTLTVPQAAPRQASGAPSSAATTDPPTGPAPTGG
jgi:hypothetical protein